MNQSAYAHRHADAFYEWKSVGGRKQPSCIGMRGQALFGMAALWEHWEAPDGKVVESCTIVTVDANSLIAELHDRMPLILAPDGHDARLAAGTGDAALPRAVAAEDMVAYPVSPLVSNARNDVPACLVPIERPEILQPAVALVSFAPFGAARDEPANESRDAKAGAFCPNALSEPLPSSKSRL